MTENITLEDVISKYTPIIINYCLPRLKYNYHNAEEVASSVMITLYKKWGPLKKENIHYWLYKVADNHIKKVISKRAKELKHIEFISIDDLSANNELFQDDLFETTLSEIETEQYLNLIISNLNKEEQELFEYRYIKAKKLQEISKMTNLPYTTLHNKYSKLENKIRNFINETVLLE